MICRQDVLCGAQCRLDGEMVYPTALLDLISTARNCGLRSSKKAVVTTLFLDVLQPLRYYQKRVYVERWVYSCKNALNLKNFLRKIENLIENFISLTHRRLG